MDAKPVNTRADSLLLQAAKAMRVPMSLVDHRPWVPTHDESHPEELGCRCLTGGPEPLTGLLGHSGVGRR